MSPKYVHALNFVRKDFHILEEFAALESNRKMLLCDHLFSEGLKAFQNTVALLWPKADQDDMKKLEKFLILLKNTAH